MAVTGTGGEALSVREPGAAARAASLACAVAALLPALASLAAWGAGAWQAVTFGEHYVPMAPSTAALVLLLGAAILDRARPGGTGRALAAAVATLIVSAVLLAAARGGGSSPERWPLPRAGTVAGIPVGVMSPATAAALLALALALLLDGLPGAAKRSRRATAALLALAALAVALAVLAGYLVGAPLFYEGETVPMALLSAVSLALLAAALLARAYPRGGPLGVSGMPLAVLAATAAVLVAGGLLELREEVAGVRQAEVGELEAIADLKVQEIAYWYRHRRGDAELLLANPSVMSDAADLLRGAGDAATESGLASWMRSLAAVRGYSSISLRRRDGTPRLEVGAEPGLEDPAACRELAEAMQSAEVVVEDLRSGCGLAGADGRRDLLRMGFWVPVREGGGEGEPVAGAFLLVVDPGERLFPRLAKWPRARGSAAAYLVRREGDRVVLLSPLRRAGSPAPGTALRRRPGAGGVLELAARGAEGAVEGPDPAGTVVYGVVRPVPGTPWSLVAQVDRTEARMPLHAKARDLAALLLALVGAAGLGAALLVRRQRELDLRRELAAAGAVAESEEKFRNLAENALVGVYLLRSDGSFAYANPRLAEILGYSVEECLAGLTLTHIFIEEEVPRVLELFKRRVAGELVRDRRTYRCRTKGGEVRHIEVFGSGTTFEGLPAAMGVVEDVTERVRLEARLREEEEIFRLFMEHSPIYFFFKDDRCRALRLSRNYERLLGRPLGELLGRGMEEIFPAELARSMVEDDRRVLAGGRPVEVEEEFGGRWYHTYKFPIFKEGAARYLAGYTIDVTERRLAAEKIRLLNEGLEERVRERTAALEAANRELEAFSYSVSHDLRTPLRALDGFSQLLCEDFADALPPEARERLGRIRAAAQRMGRLVDALLLFSRFGRRELRRVPTDPGAIARAVAEELRAAEGGREIDVAVGELPPCSADPELLRQVFVNLLANALKFTRRRARARIEVGSRHEGGETVFFVRDNGVGFDAADAARLFGVFERLHRDAEYEGTGVGLAIVRRIIERHGGRIWAEGAPGEGAAFLFTLAPADADHLHQPPG